MKKISAIRGAVSAVNTKESIKNQTVRLIKEIIEQNDLRKKDFISIQFSITKDLTVLNPATALRLGINELPYDLCDIPLFCTQEAFIEGGLECVIRVLITGCFKNKKKLKFVYLDDAKKLRPDIAK